MEVNQNISTRDPRELTDDDLLTIIGQVTNRPLLDPPGDAGADDQDAE